MLSFQSKGLQGNGRTMSDNNVHKACTLQASLNLRGGAHSLGNLEMGDMGGMDEVVSEEHGGGRGAQWQQRACGPRASAGARG